MWRELSCDEVGGKACKEGVGQACKEGGGQAAMRLEGRQCKDV